MTREQAQKLVQEAIFDYCGMTPGKYKLTHTLLEIGLGSLDIVQMMLEVEEKLGLDNVPGSDILISGNATVNTVIDLVEKVTTTLQ